MTFYLNFVQAHRVYILAHQIKWCTVLLRMETINIHFILFSIQAQFWRGPYYLFHLLVGK